MSEVAGFGSCRSEGDWKGRNRLTGLRNRIFARDVDEFLGVIHVVHPCEAEVATDERLQDGSHEGRPDD